MYFSTLCGVGETRGIYLREPNKVNKPSEINITVKPEFNKDQLSKCE